MFTFLFVYFNVSAYETPFLVTEEASILPACSLPGLMILAAGGSVGLFILVTQIPIGIPLVLLFFFLFKMILRCVGLVTLRKYYGFLHQN